MTVEDNICVVPRLLGWDTQRPRKRAAELLELVELDPAIFLKRYPRSSRAVSSSVSASCAHSPPIRPCCSWTSRSAPSIRSIARSSRTNS